MRIAIVNDTVMIAEALRRVVLSAGQHEVSWIALDGAAAVANCRQDLPDLILMDIEMPVMDGVEATRRIMSETPCAILVVTETLDARADKVFDCLGSGALDAMKMPALTGEPGANGVPGVNPLLAKIHTLSRLINNGEAQLPAGRNGNGARPCRQLVVVGASAGGPDAVATVLESLPADFPAGIIVVQHIDFKFIGSLASWLEQRSTLPVRLARHGDAPECGIVLLADSHNHLRFAEADRLTYTREPENAVYRPSIDVLFESAARHWKGEVAGVLLTGMGRDGAMGMKALFDRGALTIAQSAASSVVYGMPKAAVALGAAKEVVQLRRIAGRLCEQFPAKREQPQNAA